MIIPTRNNKTLLLLLAIMGLSNCVTPEVGRRIRELEQKVNDDSLYNENVANDTIEYATMIFKQGEIHGVIFQEPLSIRTRIATKLNKQFEKHTPSINEIQLCENKLKFELNSGLLKGKHPNDISWIITNYKQYLRQYFGAQDSNNVYLDIHAGIVEASKSYYWYTKESNAWGGGASFWFASCRIHNETASIYEFSVNDIQ